MPAWIRFTLLRLAVFLGVLVLLLLVGLDWFWAAIVAAVIGFCVSFIFFRPQREAVAVEWAARRPAKSSDEESEDRE